MRDAPSKDSSPRSLNFSPGTRSNDRIAARNPGYTPLSLVLILTLLRYTIRGYHFGLPLRRSLRSPSLSEHP
ncbi:hypothetical protein FRIGORI9N_70071 [Frigoribacterium sp. 9N]|nr:hypothetical protein FRIGORI9N_70071 [Frigoribacterium sp. 9N]